MIVNLQSTKKIFQVLLVVMFLFLLSGCWSSLNHIEYLSKGGEDTIENAIAVCPNCHAKIHQLELKGDKEKLPRKVQERNL